MNTIVFDFPSTLRMTALNMLRFDAKFAGFRPSFLLGGTSRKSAQQHFGLKPRHVEKFRKCRLTDVGESELVDKNLTGCSVSGDPAL